MYLLEGTLNQSHQANIDSLREPSDTKMFLVNSTIGPLHSKTTPKTLRQIFYLIPITITLQPLLFALLPFRPTSLAQFSTSRL